MDIGIRLVVQGSRRRVGGVRRREGAALGRLGVPRRPPRLLAAPLDPLVAVLERRGEVLPELSFRIGYYGCIRDVGELLREFQNGFCVVLVLVVLGA